MLTTFAGSLAVALYLAATVLLAGALRPAAQSRSRQAMLLALVAALLHALTLYDGVLVPGGLDLGFFHALSLATWVIVVLLLLLHLRAPVANLGLGLLPLAALAVLLALLFAGVPTAPTVPTRSSQLDFHVLVSISAYAVLSIAAMQAILLGLQQRLLHEHHPGGILRALPPLSMMETLLFRMIAIGFVLLTVALLSGFVFLEDMFAQHLVHKTVLSIIAWIVFAVLLAGHHLVGWRGPTAVRFTLGGIVLLVLAYFGSKFVLELILERA
ncbi:MAG: cytochrome c biogenesis protein CcsA [Candidatus Competibacterales bacterium]|nr:cytochrome c biogenesis protein CcsA [Candidatus Competibacterales bacterium]